MRLRSKLLVLAIVAAAPCVVPELAGAAVGALELESASVPVKGSPLELTLGAARGRSLGGARPTLYFALTRGDGDASSPTSGSESHVIYFRLDPKMLRVSFRGRMTLRIQSGKGLGRWGAIDMTFRAKAPSGTTTLEGGSDSCTADGDVYTGVLRGSLALRLVGMKPIRITSLKVKIRSFRDVPGCFLTPVDFTDPSSPTVTRNDDGTLSCTPAEQPGGLSYTALSAGDDLFDANDDPLPAGGARLGIAQIDASPLRLGLVTLAVLDPAAKTAPATLYHYVAFTGESPLLTTDPAAGTASATFDDPLLTGSLSYTRDPLVAPLACSGRLYSVGTLAGSVTAHFAWGGDYTFAGNHPAMLFTPVPSAPIGTP